PKGALSRRRSEQPLFPAGPAMLHAESEEIKPENVSVSPLTPGGLPRNRMTMEGAGCGVGGSLACAREASVHWITKRAGSAILQLFTWENSVPEPLMLCPL